MRRNFVSGCITIACILALVSTANASTLPGSTGNFGTVIEAYQMPGYGRAVVYSGYNVSINSYAWTFDNMTDPIGHGAGNVLDLHWLNPLGTGSYVIWDMGYEVSGVRVFPTQDHLGFDMTTGEPNSNPDNPNEWEYHEYDVYVSNSPTGPWTQVTETAFWIEGYAPDPAIADDAVKDYDFGGTAYRYVKISPRDPTPYRPGELPDYEIDAVEALSLEVKIDIKPGSYPNSINLKSKGVIPVAILTTNNFNANTVDGSTVKFEGASPVHDNGHLEDVDGDGDVDWLGHFKTQETGIEATDKEATINGKTKDRRDFTGKDSVNIVGGPKGAPSLNPKRKLTTTWANVKSK